MRTTLYRSRPSQLLMFLLTFLISSLEQTELRFFLPLTMLKQVTLSAFKRLLVLSVSATASKRRHES